MAKKSDNSFDPMDVSKMFANFSVPGVDWQEIMASQQKNIAALTEANQRLIEGAQAVMQQQSAIMSKAMAELTAANQELMQEGDPQAGAQKRFDLAKTSFESAVGNMQELAELAGQSNSEAMEIINKRAAEAFEEIRQLIESKKA
ncbi:MAG: phasin family protein [Alphaproteobacteria bacterium]|nr:phasin family protein [Alphaproteobacteria bacterium]